MEKVSIVIPVHNEEGNIVLLTNALNEAIAAGLPYLFEVIFVDDGSKDNTMGIIKEVAHTDSRIHYLSFSRNFGKDNALMAGLQYSSGDALITMDADLQHPPEMIAELIDWWKKGFDVVYAYRKEKNEHAGFFKQISSHLFYRMVNRLSDIKLEKGIADFRIINRRIVDVMLELNENDPFFRGLLKWAGFKQKGIPYKPNARFTGQTKYSTSKLVSLALHGITSFSTKPLEFATYLGLLFSFCAILYVPYIIISYLRGLAVSGWASLIATIVFFGGLQLFVLGIIGIYIGKIFMQVKQRPHYIIKETNLHVTRSFAKL